LIYTNWCDQRDFKAYGYFWPKPCTFLQTDLSASGPAGVLSQRMNQVLRVPDLDGDARRIHGDLSWFGQRKALRLAVGEYCISLHLSACVGVTSCERGNRA
jgi:hypothetical protein